MAEELALPAVKMSARSTPPFRAIGPLAVSWAEPGEFVAASDGRRYAVPELLRDAGFRLDALG